MKPDGADTATMEATVALGADPVIEVAPLGEGEQQAPPTSQTEGIGQVEPQQAETPAAATKTNKSKPSDPKAKTKTGIKTKTPTKTPAAGARPTTAPSRMTNGVQKPQTNGVAKKTAPEKKSTSTTAAPLKKPAASTGVGTIKTSSTKPAGAARPATAPSNGTKTGSSVPPAKKVSGASANGDKAKPKAAGPAARPASAGPTKPISTSSPKPDRPPAAKTAKPAAGPPSTRPTSVAVKTATTTTSKTTSTSKPSPAAKTATSTAKPSPAKTTAPPAGRTPTQPSKTTTPIKKDVSKPSTPAAKKPAASPVSRPATSKTTKPDGPKTTTPAKPESASKKPSAPGKAAADAKSSKPKDSKPTASKEVSASPKTPSVKNSTAKTASPKKTVGSSTPVPVKRGPKAAQTAQPAVKESEKEDVVPAVEAATVVHAVAATTAAIGAFTMATNELEVQAEPTSELVPKPNSEVLPELSSEVAAESSSALPVELQSEFLHETKSEFLHKTESEVAPESSPEFLLETKTEVIPESKPEFLHEAECELAPETKPEFLHEKELAPEMEPEFQIETQSQVASGIKSEFLFEKESEVVPETTSEYLFEKQAEIVPETRSEILFEKEAEIVPETRSEILFEKEPEVVPETRSEILFEKESEVVPETTSEYLFEKQAEIVPETRSEILFEKEAEVVPETRSEFLFEKETEIVPETTSEFLFEKESEVVPETTSEILFKKEAEVVHETRSKILFDKESEVVPEIKTAFLLETESEVPSQTIPEFLSEMESELPPESRPEPLSETKSELALESKPEFLMENTSEFATEPKAENLVETKTEFLLETQSELVPELESELQLENKSAFEPEPIAEILEVKSELSPEPLPEITHEPTVDTFIPAAAVHGAEYTEDTQDIPSDLEEETAENVETDLPSQLDQESLREPVSAPPLGTTVMSPPSSPTECEEPKVSAPWMDMHVPADPWTQSEQLFSCTDNLEKENTRSQEDILVPTESAPEDLVDAGKTYMLSPSPLEPFSSASPTSPSVEREEAVEKAEQEINEDDDDEEERDEEEEEQEEREVVKSQTVPQTERVEGLKLGLPEYNTSGWGMIHSDDAGISDQQEKTDTNSPFQMESPQNDENVQDFFLKKVEMEQPFMGPPGVKSFSDEEEDDDDDDHQVRRSIDFASMYASERHADFGLHAAVDQHGNIPQHFESQNEQQSEDVEMVSEGLVETGIEGAGKVDVDDYDEGYLDNLNRTAPAPSMPTTAAWGSANPFADTWAQPASLHMTSSPLDIDADPEMPTKSPAEAWLEQPLGHSTEPHLDVREQAEGLVPADSSNLAIPTVGMSQSSTLSGAALAAHSSSETSTPEELRDYDSSSGVESHSDKQQTPVPAAQPDQDQDLGIHLERGDGEEEEAETLPADEVLGDAPTAPASAPSSQTTSGDEASDTEGEMQINDPDAPADDAAAFDSPSASRNLTALEEDEEAADMHAGEEDGGTPQSANSVASYGFDCSASNSNAHSTAESCGKSPGIFSLENEDQLPEEAKDPSLIKELTLPAAAAHPEDLLGRPVDLLPIAQHGESYAGTDHQCLLGEKTGASVLEDVGPELPLRLSPQHEDTTDEHPPYYSAICDKTDSFLAGLDNPPPLCRREVQSTYPLRRDVRDSPCCAPLQLPRPRLRLLHQQDQPTRRVVELGRLPAATPTRPPGALARRHRWQEKERRRQLERQRRQEQDRRQWQEEKRQRLERRRGQQLLRWQQELGQRHRLRRQRPQPSRHSPPLVGLCTIYEAMETSEDKEEEESSDEPERRGQSRQAAPTSLPPRPVNGTFCLPPLQALDWSAKVDVVRQLINRALLLEGAGGGCPPLLRLPGQGGGILSPLESSLWPHVLPPLNHTWACITSVSSYSPTTRGGSPQGDWTVVELETHH